MPAGLENLLEQAWEEISKSIHQSVSGIPKVESNLCCLEGEVWLMISLFLSLFKKYLFLDRGREGEGEGENHGCVVASRAPLLGSLACNPGMCPRLRINQRPFGSQASAQSPEPHQPGLEISL